MNNYKVKYHVLVTQNPSSRLDSICALRRDVMHLNNIGDFETTNEHYEFLNGKPGDKFYLNVIA